MSSFNSGFPPVQQQIIDPGTNMVSNVWSSWFQLFYNEYVATASSSDNVYAQVTAQATSLTALQSQSNNTSILQIVPFISYGTSSSTSGFGINPAPTLSAAGQRIMTCVFTPKSATSTILIDVKVNASLSAEDYAACGLYNTNNQTILAGHCIRPAGDTNLTGEITFSYSEPSTSLLTRTYVLQVGTGTGAGAYLGTNYVAGHGLMSGRSATSVIITEFE